MKNPRKWMALMLCLILFSPAAFARIASPKAISGGYFEAGSPSGSEATTQSASRNDLAGEVVRQVNAERQKAGLGQLTVSAELTRAARVRAGEIVRKFSHTRPDGTAWHTVSSAAYGENIAMGQRTADKVMAAWLTSQGHRANILRASFGSIGVCAIVSGGVTYWVQLFGK